jgi:hypothetical protein
VACRIVTSRSRASTYRYGPAKARRRHWFTQGWYAAHGQPHAAAPKGQAYQMFQ